MALDRFREQFLQIQRELSIPLAMGPDEGDGPDFIHERGCVLARPGDAGLVEQVVADTFRTEPRAERLFAARAREAGPGDVTRIQVGRPTARAATSGTDPDVVDVMRALRGAEDQAGRRLVSRNHLVTIAVNACPGDEPVLPTRPTTLNPAAGMQTLDPGPVKVLVIDTGLVPDYTLHWWNEQIDGVPGDTLEVWPGGVPGQYAGHGTFIAGIVAAIAPDATIEVRNTLGNAGAILESELGDKLFEAVGEDWPDIISLSAGTPIGAQPLTAPPLMGLEEFMRVLREDHPSTLLVAAAGNNGSSTPFWPAAYAGLPQYADAVVSVGALRTDGQSEACFTNYGPWVTVYAPGERLTSSFVGKSAPYSYTYQHSTYATCRHGGSYLCSCQSPPHIGALSEELEPTPAEPDTVVFDGFARWSGTSFSTPAVAALIARHMAAHKGTDARAAARELFTDNTGTAQIHGTSEPALRPSDWTPGEEQRSLP